MRKLPLSLVIGLIALATLMLVAPPLLDGQVNLPDPLRILRISNITSSATVIDNRSMSTRQNDNHSFIATGTGTWSVQMEWSDTSAAGPWTSFGASALVTNTSSTNSGVGIGYHQFIRFNITGNATVHYGGVKGFYTSTPASGSGLIDPGSTGLLKRTTPGQTAVANASDVTTTLGFTPENTAKRNAVDGYVGTGPDGRAAYAQLPADVVNATALSDGLATKANTSHGHGLADTTGLEAALNARLLTSQLGQANGVANVGADGRIPRSLLCSGTPDNSTFCRGDGLWATPAGGGNVSTSLSGVAGRIPYLGNASGTILLDSGLAYTDIATNAALTSGLGTKVNASDIVTSIGAPGSNAKVPSEAALRTALDNKLNVADMIGSVGSPGSASRVPTEEAVRSALNAKQDSLGFTPENTAVKNANSGYMGLGPDARAARANLPAATVYTDQAAAFGAGKKVSMQPDATTAGMRLICSVLPSAPVSDDLALDSNDGCKLKRWTGAEWETITGGAPAGGDATEYAANFTSASTWTILGADHTLATCDLTAVVLEDVAGTYRAIDLEPDCNNSTFDVTADFGALTLTGRMVLKKKVTTSAPIFFSSLAVWSIPAATYGQSTCDIEIRTYENISGNSRVLEGGQLDCNATTKDITITFASAQTGRAVLYR